MRGLVSIINRGTVDRNLLHWVRSLPTWVALGVPAGNHIPHSRNVAAAETEPDFVLYVDSDSHPPLDALARLLAWDVPLVGGVVCERFPPWRVCAVRSMSPPSRIELADIPREGLVPVAALGTGCLLVRRPVFAALAPPWFRCGQIIPDLLLEDTDFCFRAKDAGFQPYLDAGLRVGHSIGGVVWPGRNGRPWVAWRDAADTREEIDRVLAVDAELTR